MATYVMVHQKTKCNKNRISMLSLSSYPYNAKLNRMNMSLYNKYLYVFAICLLFNPSKRKYIKTSSGKPKDYFRLPASALFVSFNVKNGYNVLLWFLRKYGKHKWLVVLSHHRYNLINIHPDWYIFAISIFPIFVMVMDPKFWRQLLFCIYEKDLLIF